MTASAVIHGPAARGTLLRLFCRGPSFYAGSNRVNRDLAYFFFGFGG